MSRWLVLVALLAARVAAADDPAPETPPPDPEWQQAPKPDQASGIVQEESETPRDKAKKVAAVMLWPFKWVVWGVAQPVRGSVYVYDKYGLPGVYDRTFYNETKDFGIYPTAKYESGFGVTIGARAVHHDVFGAHERLKLRADFGGQYRFGYGVNLRSGERLGDRVAVELDFGHERRPNQRFYGIGNLDALPAAPEMPIDPMDGAWATRFREDKVSGIGRVDVKLTEELQVHVSAASSFRNNHGIDAVDSIEQTYDTSMLVGWNSVKTVQSQAELVYDSRRPTNPYMSRALDATGWYAATHIGSTRGFGGDQSRFDTYGGEVARYFDLFRGSRILVLRGAVETVANDDYISFLDLPRLGGSEYLRGYQSSRFRDRASALTSAEYTWDLGNFMAAYTFVDVGRVYHSLRDIELSAMRVGYGGGIQLHTSQSYVGRVQVAANRDGDVFLELALSPAFPRRDRVGSF